MENNFLFLLCFFLSFRAFAGASSYLLMTGHREAMQANGGATGLCSPGQFFKNPAGLHCDYNELVTESFGSTNFYSAQAKMESDGGSLQDLQGSESQTGPGTSLFSQSVHQKDHSYGLWGVLGNFSFDKSYAYAPLPGVRGTIQSSSTNSALSAGGFWSQRNGNFHWGLTLGLVQNEYRWSQLAKYNQSGQYSTENSDYLSIERGLTSLMGLTYVQKDARYAFIFSPSNIPLWGKVRKESTQASTGGQFNEESKTGDAKTTGGASVTGSYEYLFSDQRTLGFELTWTDQSESNYDSVGTTQSQAASVAAVIFSQYQIDSQLYILSGLRWFQSVKEEVTQQKIQAPMATLGLLRKYKSAEIGTGLGYTQMTSTTQAHDNSLSSSVTLDRFDVILSSSFTY
jgi:hypothetical protein